MLKALTSFISTFGVPKIVQTDQGSNFMSRTFSHVLKQLRVEHHVSSAYHPESQGVLERFHQTLKSMLRSYCTELSQDWEEGLPWLLLAIWEVSQTSTGFSPNELVFAHSVWGPLSVLGGDLKPEEPPENVWDYVNDFRRRLYIACATAHKNIGGAQKKMKEGFDQKADSRLFEPGDQVLVLLPVIGSPFQARFSGPYTVKSRMSDRDYLIATPDRRKKVQWCHVNLLKSFLTSSARKDSDTFPVGDGVAKPVATVDAGLWDNFDVPSEPILTGKLKNSEYLNGLYNQFSYISDTQRRSGEIATVSFVTLFRYTVMH